VQVFGIFKGSIRNFRIKMSKAPFQAQVVGIEKSEQPDD